MQGESLNRSGSATSIHLTIFDLPANVTALMAGMTTSPVQNDVAVIAGNNPVETGAVPENTFAQRRAADNGPRPGLPQINVRLAAFQSAAKRKFGSLADEFLKLYPASNDDEAALQSNQAARDNSRVSTYVWGTDWRLHATKPVYTSFWRHRPTADPGGAHHGSRFFLCSTIYISKINLGPMRTGRSPMMSSYWAKFRCRR